ncbi:MAG TPA: hypothetical protein DEB40_11760 [Elusimicrobia bacterium]|nr:hypothetical protein [Elusimicrobiota bacterium]HBT62408.1 hypothetical protein [Elusimicrobiota bacterium]
MIPVLGRALFAAFLALSCGWPVHACRLCENPPQVPPQQLAPNDPFDLRSPPGLLPGDLEYIIASGNGSYRRQEPYLVDYAAKDARRHLVTYAQVQPLLRSRTKELAAQLRIKEKSRSLNAADRKQALLLYWYRGPFLGGPDRAFLDSLNPTALGKPGLPSLASKPDSGAVSSKGSSRQADLAGRLLAQIELTGDAAQKAALTEAIALILATPTGRQLAEEFAASGAKARISFLSMPNSRVVKKTAKRKYKASRLPATAAAI